MFEYFAVITVVVAISIIFWPQQRFQKWRSNFINKRHAPISITNTKKQTLSLADYQNRKQKSKIQISLVVPSYNEEARLSLMLADVAKYFKGKKIVYEIIIANDGSKDRTTEVALQEAVKLDLNLVVVQYPKNRGKGGAVKAGVEVAEGKYLLMVDADGATTFSELDKVWQKLKDMVKASQTPLAMVVGSRRHLQQQGKVERKLHRKIVSAVFKLIITIVLGIKTKDTQCGFKLFTRESAKMLFKALHVQRFAFDVQVFFLCNLFKIETAQVGVQWRDVDGSKLSVMDASVNMLRDVLMIRLFYFLSLWRDSDQVTVQQQKIDEIPIKSVNE